MTAQASTPAWLPCGCGNFTCAIHGGHVHDCACPDLETWDQELALNPYQEGGELTPAQLARLVPTLTT